MSDSLTRFASRLADRIEGLAPLTDFDGLASELFSIQYQANPAYRRWCDLAGRTPSTAVDWRAIPAVPTVAFQELELTSLPADRRTTVFHSSGTTEQRPSRNFHDAASLALYEASALAWFTPHLVPERQRASELDQTTFVCLSLTPPPASAPRSSLVHMLGKVMERHGAMGSAFLGGVRPDTTWDLNVEEARAFLDGQATTGRPVMVMGTAFQFLQLTDFLAGQKRRCVLPAGSRAMETGGYKGRTREVPKDELHRAMASTLGLSLTSIVSEYGMCELSSQAYDRRVGPAAPGAASTGDRCFRLPPWARSVVISPETGRAVDDGEVGLLRVYDLANVWSVMAVQTGDRARRRGDGFELLGRAPAAEARGCSLQMA